MGTVEKFYTLILSFSLRRCARVESVVWMEGAPYRSCCWPPYCTTGLSIPLFLFPICSIPLSIHHFPFAPVAPLAHMVKDERVHKFHFKPFILPASFIHLSIVSHEGPWRAGPPILLHLGVFIWHAKLLRLKNKKNNRKNKDAGLRMMDDLGWMTFQSTSANSTSCLTETPFCWIRPPDPRA